MNFPWYHIQNIDEIDSPALVVFPDRIQKNIEQMIAVAGDVQCLRPHVKTHKMSEVVTMQLDQGIQKFKCATIAEAEMLGKAGAPDVLLAYQPIGPKAHRFLNLVEKFPQTKYACLVDNEIAASHLAKLFSQRDMLLQIWLDLDVGHHRTGIFADERARDLFVFCKNKKGIDPVGLHVYDGHLRDSDFATRKKRSDTCFELVENLLKDLANLGYDRPQVVAGGSPTFPVHALRQHVDCSPGTCLMWDYGYHNLLPDQSFDWAALVISRVISKPGNQFICVDLGHKSIAAEQPFPRVHFLNLPEAKAVSQSEEHLVLDVGNNADYQVGAVLYGVPIHICPTCALYEKAFVIEHGNVTKEWRVVARDRRITV